MVFAGMEWIIVLIVIVILFIGGGKKIPEFAQSLGRARGEFERGKMEVEKEISAERSKQPAPVGLRFCTKCGAPGAPEAAFCPRCGTALPAAN